MLIAIHLLRERTKDKRRIFFLNQLIRRRKEVDIKKNYPQEMLFQHSQDLDIETVVCKNTLATPLPGTSLVTQW